MRSPRVPVLASFTVVILAAFGHGPALAAGCDLDGNNHPGIGYMFAQQSDPNTCSAELIASCGATLVSPTVAITTGDCAFAFSDPNSPFNITAVWVNFDGGMLLGCGNPSRIASFHLHPGYDPSTPESGTNIGVLVLDAAASVTPASLPAAGALDLAARGDLYDQVAPGTIDTDTNVLDTKRRFTTLPLARVNATHIKMRERNKCVPAVQGGGIFEPGSLNLVAMTDALVGGGLTGFHLRLDTATVRDFLDDFVTLP